MALQTQTGPLAAAIVAATAICSLVPASRSPQPAWPVPDLVQLQPGTFRYRAAGDFTRDGKPATAPLVAAAIVDGLMVMTNQVTVADYGRCVDAGSCRSADRNERADVPMVKVSWWDAAGYAEWLSRVTGRRFRIPTDEEWVYAAGSRFRDDAGPEGIDDRDPGTRALDRFERETASADATDMAPQPVGHFSANERGLLDIAGNVWEWTNSCFVRGILDAGGRPSTTTVNCGVRLAEGRHRAYLTDFIRDARAGGCTAGVPPSNLGLRLVAEDDRWRGSAAPLVWAR